jgi:C4-type Zn-finger protein
MAESKRECPMCGEFMRRVEHERVTRVPGFTEVQRMTIREWVCPECDYFEEDDEGDAPAAR